MFQLLLEHQQSQPSRVEQFFSTHPLTQDRLEDARSRAARIGNRGITDEPQFQEIRRRV
jgi:predicted Zn-dependent protease